MINIPQTSQNAVITVGASYDSSKFMLGSLLSGNKQEIIPLLTENQINNLSYGNSKFGFKAYDTTSKKLLEWSGDGWSIINDTASSSLVSNTTTGQTIIDISTTNPPTAGQVLTALSATQAVWGTPTYSGIITSSQYDLPVATSILLGGVKPDGTSILNSSGVISATAASVGALASGGTAANSSQLLGYTWASPASIGTGTPTTGTFTTLGGTTITASTSFSGPGTNLSGTATGLTVGLAQGLTGSPNITVGTISSNAISITASTGIIIPTGAPGTTTNTLYSVSGTLYFNGNALSTATGITTLTGDVTATGNGSVAATVAGIKGITVPTLAVGYLYYNGSAYVWQTPSNSGGTVTGVSTAAANNGITATWSMASPTPALTIGLGSITPTSVNGLTISNSAGTLTIPTGATLATTGAYTITLNSTAASTATMPASTSAVINYYTSAPAQYGLPYAGAASGLMTYLAVPSAPSVLTGTTGAAPAWITAVMATTQISSPSWASTMTLTTAGYSLIRITLGGTTTLNFSAGADGQILLLELKQDGTGSRLVTWGTGVEFGTSFTSITLTTTLNLTDTVRLVYNSSNSKWRILGYSLGYA